MTKSYGVGASVAPSEVHNHFSYTVARTVTENYEEDKFVQAFADAGFYGVHLVKRDAKPWQVAFYYYYHYSYVIFILTLAVTPY